MAAGIRSTRGSFIDDCRDPTRSIYRDSVQIEAGTKDNVQPEKPGLRR